MTVCEECGRRAQARGLCPQHYQAWRRARAGEPCSVDDCVRAAMSRGWCVLHYDRWRRTGTLADPTFTSTCIVAGCTRPHLARGWCEVHYRRWRRTGDVVVTEYPSRCTISGCQRQHEARGVCRLHYDRLRAATLAPRCIYRLGCLNPRHSARGLCQTHARWDDRRTEHATLSAEVASWGYLIEIPLADFVRFGNPAGWKNRNRRRGLYPREILGDAEEETPGVFRLASQSDTREPD